MIAPGLLGAAARGLALGICETVMPIPGFDDYLFRHVRKLFASEIRLWHFLGSR